MDLNHHLLAAVLSVLVSYGCYCQEADKRNDVPMSLTDDEDYMTFRDGSGDGKNGGLEEGETRNGDDERDDNGKDSGLLPVSVMAITAGLTLVVFVIILIVTTGLIYLLQKKRAIHRKKHNQQNVQRSNVNGDRSCRASLNIEYETIGSDCSNPVTIQMSHYESPIAVDKSNFEYDYPINTVRVRCVQPENTYLNAN